MGTITVSLPADDTGADVADYNTPITTIVNLVNGNIDNNNISATAAIAGSKLADDSVTAVKLDSLSIAKYLLGYTISTTAQTNISTLTDLTGLSAAVTVPSGAKILITGLVPLTNKVSGINGSEVYIYEGATRLATSATNYPALNYNSSCSVSCILTPTAGSHTYKLRSASVVGNVDTMSAAGSPSYILVQIIG